MTTSSYHQERGLLSGRKVHERPEHTTTVRREVVLAASPEEVFDFCLSVDGYSFIMPYRVDVIGYSSAQLEAKMAIAFRVRFKHVFPVRWVAYLEEMDRPHRFVDLQTRGLFRYFRHTHVCEPHADGTRYRDQVEFATGWGRWVDSVLMRRELQQLFTHRQNRMSALLGSARSPE
ncbi:SRPBCC family protein [Allosaccharopolyspora coralli]|uniref:SRPBCC family protein n=1 Tax=Allosaccharopolyspora coralli TaxID=2665642 RepID=UPI0016528B86|nr:SRPBCC family protein [Allosaccharopolyspora coralli]